MSRQRQPLDNDGQFVLPHGMQSRIAIANQKGGVGKTTTAVNLAAALAARGQRTLLLDLDPQGNATTSFGASGRSVRDATYHLLQPAASSPQPGRTAVDNLDLLGGSMNLAGLDIELAPEAARCRRLRDALQARRWQEYELIFVDCPPSFGVLTLNALAACDHVLVPLQCEFFALEGLAHLTRTLDAVRRSHNPALNLLGIVLTMYDRRNNLSELVANDVRSYFGDAVLATTIPRNVRLSEAPSHGLPISLYDPRSPGAVAYERLADEVLARVAPNAVEHA